MSTEVVHSFHSEPRLKKPCFRSWISVTFRFGGQTATTQTGISIKAIRKYSLPSDSNDIMNIATPRNGAQIQRNTLKLL